MNDRKLIRLQPRGQHHTISQGRTVLTTALDGSVQPNGDQGLWVYQTRMLSRYEWRVNGKAPTLSVLSATEQHRDLAYYIFSPPECKHEGSGCDPAQQAIELRIERVVGEGLREIVTLSNHTMMPSTFHIELKVEADFADHAETRGPRKQRGRRSISWKTEKTISRLNFDYKIKHRYRHQGDLGTASLHRGIRLELSSDQQRASHRNGTIRFRVRLKPRQTWRATLQWIAQMESVDQPFWGATADQRREVFVESSTEYSAGVDPSNGLDLTSTVMGTLRQARSDFSALRLFDLDGRDALGPTWIPAAGLPIYVGFFGRDILFSARESASLSTALMRGSLSVLGNHLGDKIDDWRDEQPGRMVHELHQGPLAALNYTPHGSYFGTITGSFFYASLLSELWRWTGNQELIRPLIEPALRGLRWADKYSRDESGFYKYQTRSTQGEKNQGWKDSGDAIVHADGSQVPDPLGTCEMQSYMYGSKMGIAEVLARVGQTGDAKKIASEAQELKKRFNDFFWMKDENYLAMGIDSKNRQIRSIASDPGHALMNDIVDESRKNLVGKRLMSDEMFSGWGVRTLSSRHPAYNPFSYHCGTVWPVENAMFVLALAGCGLHEEMNRLAKAIFESAALFKFHRLPELFGGHPRDDQHPFPGLYPKANSPQAWSAAGPFLVIEAMLGIRPDAINRTVYVDPHLPDWLPNLRVSRLTVGDATVDLEFRREQGGATAFEVLQQQGTLTVMRKNVP